MSDKITKDVEIFLSRAAHELLKANPGLKADSEITQEMVTSAFEAVLKRDQQLLKAVSNPAFVKVMGLQVYNACRVEGLKKDHERQLEDERNAGNYRTARMAYELTATL